MTATQDDPIADLQRTIAELRRERDAALTQRQSDYGERAAHQAATIDVLKLMAASPGDPQPVFDMIVTRARDLCDAYGVTVTEFDGTLIHHRASTGISDDPAVRAARLASYPKLPERDDVQGRAILDRCLIRVDDLEAEPGLHPAARGLTAKSVVVLPMLRGGAAIGTIGMGSRERGGFSDTQIELLKTFAEQAVIAITSAETYRALQARTAELTARDADNRALIARQQASIEVLRAISTSPDDAQPVLDLIVRHARTLCNAQTVNFVEYDGSLLHQRAVAGYDRDPEALGQFLANFPRPPGPETLPGRVVLSGQPVHLPDAQNDLGIFRPGRGLGARSFYARPLLREGRVIGVLVLGRYDPGEYDQSAIDLVQSFAEQAVIALSSAAALKALRERTADLQESLEYQTATSDVLQVISRSTFDLQPVLDTVVESAARLCVAEMAMIFRRDGDIYRLAVSYGFPPDFETFMRQQIVSPGRGSMAARTALEGRIVHVPDVAADPEYELVEAIELGQSRTCLGVPLLREAETIGTIVLVRRRVEPFTERQIELVRTFADQAVIAIENARLITEQQEALEQQTATAEVLQVINASPGNLTPVFDAMLGRALRQCGAAFGALHTFDGERFQIVAAKGVPPAFEAYRRQHQMPAGPDAPPGEAAITGRPVQVVDVMTHPFFVARPELQEAQINLGGIRAVLNLPLLKDGATVGMFVIYRKEPGAFTEKQIALLENFAAQAVIAMENARLITETREALEQQTATAEVLGVINASPGDLAPVFDAILDKAHALCGATIGSLFTYDGELQRAVATHGLPEELAVPIRRGVPINDTARRMTAGGTRPGQIPDIRAIQGPVSEVGRFLLERTDVRTILFVPLRKDADFLGYISAMRPEVRAFTDRQIVLLENFAAQAVIAMENARLITETREALEQQTATAEVLQVINENPGDLVPVFDAMLEKAMRLIGAAFGALSLIEGDQYRATAMYNLPEGLAEFVAERQAMVPNSSLWRLARGEPTVHIADISLDSAVRSADRGRRLLIEDAGARTALWVPLRKGETVLGAFTAYRREVRPYTTKQIALLENFAAQAVIAMENARLLTETREALEQQTATAEVLQAINESPGDLAPVFDAILNKAHTLCGAAIGSLYTWDGESVWAVATHGFPEDYAAFARQKNTPNFMTRPLIEGERYYHVADVRVLKPTQDKHASTFMEQTDARTILLIPLRKDGAFAGFISVVRTEVRPFVEKEIALLENFAAQAVIAMENARLLTETREALEQQTATAEVLQVINESPGDLTPVFETILAKAHTLCGAEIGSLGVFDGEFFRKLVRHGYPEEVDAFLGKPYPPVPQHAPLFRGETIHAPDILNYPWGVDVDRQGFTRYAQLGLRTWLEVPLWKDGTLLGTLSGWRREPRAFSPSEIRLLESFAAQAVIAMESARLMNELRARTDELAQRQAELRVTFENMGDGVAMFDESQHLAAWNRKFQDMLDVPDDVIARRQTFSEYVRYLAERGEYGPDADPDEQIRRLTERAGEYRAYERIRPNGRVIEIRHNPVPSGGFVLIYADITERKRNEAEIAAARDAAQEAARTIEAAFQELKIAQANLIQAEKMASLGQLTAGIAHEIKNPLNFVNNFASVSVDLLAELKEAAEPGFAALTEDQRAEIDDVSAMLTSNLQKITEHGKRADGIVKAMLEHSRGASGERREVDINALADEALNLAYHGARAQDQSFNITLERDFADGIAPIELNPQDITRVLLNLFGNGFYAANKRARNGAGPGFSPTLKLTTRDLGRAVEIRVRDNGTGIPEHIRDKLFQPFFTTKPTGEGTGLGLSITYDIVTKQHGGSIAVASEVDAFAEFVVTLPRAMVAGEGGRA